MTRAPFPRSARLLSGKDFDPVFRRRQRLSNRVWQVLVHHHSRGPARLGLAIAKKKAKRAVDRNRLKRVAREVFRHRQNELCGYDLVVMNAPSSHVLSAPEQHAALHALFDRIIGRGRAHGVMV